MAHQSVPRGLARVLAPPLLGILAIGALAACSSSATSSASSTALYGTSLSQQCTQVADVLSDGPDPDADPVGYAEAQVLPLRQLKLSDARLHADVLALASAYQTFSISTGSAGTAAALTVSKAEQAVNAICPGAAN